MKTVLFVMVKTVISSYTLWETWSRFQIQKMSLGKIFIRCKRECLLINCLILRETWQTPLCSISRFDSTALVFQLKVFSRNAVRIPRGKRVLKFITCGALLCPHISILFLTTTLALPIGLQLGWGYWNSLFWHLFVTKLVLKWNRRG